MKWWKGLLYMIMQVRLAVLDHAAYDLSNIGQRVPQAPAS
jgi:hypothetical protein